MQGSWVLGMHLATILKNMQKSQSILKLNHIKTKATLFAGLSSFWMTVSKYPNVHYVHYSKKKENKSEICFKGIHINQYKVQYTKQALPSLSFLLLGMVKWQSLEAEKCFFFLNLISTLLLIHIIRTMHVTSILLILKVILPARKR